MRIVDAEADLVRDLVDETEIVVSKEKAAFTLYAGRHPTLGKVVIVEGKGGAGVIVETEE